MADTRDISHPPRSEADAYRRVLEGYLFAEAPAAPSACALFVPDMTTPGEDSCLACRHPRADHAGGTG